MSKSGVVSNWYVSEIAFDVQRKHTEEHISQSEDRHTELVGAGELDHVRG